MGVNLELYMSVDFEERAGGGVCIPGIKKEGGMHARQVGRL